MIFGREPVMVLALVQAVIAVAVAFGLHWSAEQVSLVTALSSVIIGLVARQLVTPVSAATQIP